METVKVIRKKEQVAGELQAKGLAGGTRKDRKDSTSPVPWRKQSWLVEGAVCSSWDVFSVKFITCWK